MGISNRFNFLCSLALSFLGTQASAAASSESLYLTVDGPSAQWGRETCVFLHNTLTVVRKAPSQTECSEARDIDRVRQARESGRFTHQVEYRLKHDGSAELAIRNWKPADDTEHEESVLPLSSSSTNEQKGQAITRRLENFFEYRERLPLIRELLIAKGLVESKRLGVNAKYEYVDLKNGKVLSFDQAYALYKEESPRQKAFLRTSLEIFSVIGLGAVWYWTETELNSVDWEYNFDWKSFRKKFIELEGLRFDNNMFWLNDPGHSLTGSLEYLFARTNGYGALESFLFAFVGSAIWELIVEFKEVVSINDMVFTPLAGAVIGEVLFQLSESFDRGDDTVANRVLGAIADAGTGNLNSWLGKHKSRRGKIPTDRFGFPTDVWHRFDLFAGGGRRSRPEGASGVAHVGVETQIITLEEYGKPGVVSRFIADPFFTRMNLESSFGSQGLTDFLFFTKVAFAGYSQQSLAKAKDGSLEGYSFFVAAASAHDFDLHQAKGFTDMYGVVNVLGPTVELVFYARGFKVRATFDVYGDFAAVRSYAVDKYREDHSLSFAKSVLDQQSYYFAFGVTVMPELVVSYGPLEAGAALKYHALDSIEGHDRRQEWATRDVDSKDSRLVARAWLNYTLPGDVAKLSFVVEHRRSRGSVEDVSVSARETLVLSRLVMTF